jgi:hypothetical protein
MALVKIVEMYARDMMVSEISRIAVLYSYRLRDVHVGYVLYKALVIIVNHASLLVWITVYYSLLGHHLHLHFP